jgi:hypothetical protein
MITIRPASIEDCLDQAGARPTARKRMIYMHQRGETFIIEDDGGLLALAYLDRPDQAGRREFCLALFSRARARMRELCRAAQLILGRLAEDGPIICHVVPENRAGRRMARIVGFSPDPDHRYRWIMEGPNDSYPGIVRRQQ